MKLMPRMNQIIILLVITISLTDAISKSIKSALSKEEIELLNSVKIKIHENANSETCGTAHHSQLQLVDALETVITISFNSNDDENRQISFDNKYYIDTLLTTTFGMVLLPYESCSGDNTNSTLKGLLSYCDMGFDKTPKLPDHDLLQPLLLPPGNTDTLPCHFHTREGLRITSLERFVKVIKDSSSCNTDASNTCKNDSELHLYAVSAGRQFIFAPKYIGETFDLSHVQSTAPSSTLPLYLEVLSINPKIFEVHNFFTHDESKQVIEHILQETDENVRLKRSSTGATGYTVNPKRTSEGGFDSVSPHAIALKQRCFESLGFDEYDETYADGLQILRYNETGGYVSHHDYLDDPSGTDEHNYDTMGVGTNRFATVLLYFNDMPKGSGGETVFTNIFPNDGERISLDAAIQEYRSNEPNPKIVQGSWEEELVAECRSKFSIKPFATRTILFYSQLPDGSLDDDSLHGGCPVLNGTKWAANLWVWSGPMSGEYAPVMEENVIANMKAGRATNHPMAVEGVFRNMNGLKEFEGAQLFYQEANQYFGDLVYGENPIFMNTFYGHVWEIKVNDVVVKTFHVGYGTPQYFDL